MKDPQQPVLCKLINLIYSNAMIRNIDTIKRTDTMEPYQHMCSNVQEQSKGLIESTPPNSSHS